MPGSVVLQIATTDVLIHTWDLARATGQELRLPDGLAEGALAAAQVMIGPELRVDGFFDPPVEAPVGAPAIDRLAAFAGRSV
jgi:uncharacterized protein (TIGR03086 family)